MAETERLLVSLEARVNEFEKNFRRANKASNDNWRSIERRGKQASRNLQADMARASASVASSMRGLATGFAGGLLGGLAVGTVTELPGAFRKITSSLAELQAQAKRAGVDVEVFQQLEYAASQSKVSVDALTDGLKELSLRGDEFAVTGKGSAADAFYRLGYSADELKTKLKNPSELFLEIIGRLKQLDRAAQIRVAEELFGGSGGEQFVQMIGRGEDGIRALMQSAKDAGHILDAELVAKAAEIDVQFENLARTVETRLKGAIVSAAAALTDFMARFASVEKASRGELQRRFTGLMDERRTLIDERADLGKVARGPGGRIDPMTQSQLDRIERRMGELDSLEKDIGAQLAQKPLDVPPMPGTPATPTFTPITPPSSGGGGGSSRKSSLDAIRAEKDAVLELITALEQELSLVGASEVEQRVANELRHASAAATDAQKARITELVTSIEQERASLDQLQEAMGEMKGLAKDVLGGMISDLREGKSGAEILLNAFNRLADRLIDIALNNLVEQAFGGMGSGGKSTGGGGFNLLEFLPKLFGFSDGGYTGHGGKYEPAGIVHKGEFVMDKQTTARFRPLLEAMHSGRFPGYAAGGLVDSAPSTRAAAMAINPAPEGGAPVFQISAPITINGSAGTPEQNDDLSRKMAKAMESTMRGLIVDEMRRQTRPGNFANSRSR